MMFGGNWEWIAIVFLLHLEKLGLIESKWQRWEHLVNHRLGAARTLGMVEDLGDGPIGPVPPSFAFEETEPR